jgi:RNA-binding protein YhbY
MAVIKAEVVQTIGHQLVIYRRSKKLGKITKELTGENS